jgi:hypothetical protein
MLNPESFDQLLHYITVMPTHEDTEKRQKK